MGAVVAATTACRFSVAEVQSRGRDVRPAADLLMRATCYASDDADGELGLAPQRAVPLPPTPGSCSSWPNRRRRCRVWAWRRAGRLRGALCCGSALDAEARWGHPAGETPRVCFKFHTTSPDCSHALLLAMLSEFMASQVMVLPVFAVFAKRCAQPHESAEAQCATAPACDAQELQGNVVDKPTAWQRDGQANRVDAVRQRYGQAHHENRQ